MSYLSGIYLKSRFSCLEGVVKKTLKKKKRRSRKNLKNEQKEKRRIQGKPNNNNFNL